MFDHISIGVRDVARDQALLRRSAAAARLIHVSARARIRSATAPATSGCGSAQPAARCPRTRPPACTSASPRRRARASMPSTPARSRRRQVQRQAGPARKLRPELLCGLRGRSGRLPDRGLLQQGLKRRDASCPRSGHDALSSTAAFIGPSPGSPRGRIRARPARAARRVGAAPAAFNGAPAADRRGRQRRRSSRAQPRRPAPLRARGPATRV